MKDELLKHSRRLLVALLALVPASAVLAAGVAAVDLKRAVVEAIREDPRIDSTQIAIKIADGVVTLEGQVDNLAAKIYAGLETRKLAGVRGVVNRLEITPGRYADADVADWVKRRLEHSATVNSEDIQVACRDGGVSLTGNVGSNAEKLEAGLLASEVRGVAAVSNRVVVQHGAQRDDDEIANDVHGMLGRDVYLTGRPITVAVKSGVVMLRGSVASDYERWRAVNDAWSVQHVKDVSSDLKLEPWENEGIRSVGTPPSDDMLRQNVQAELTQDQRLAGGDFQVNVSHGHVTLDGFVSNPYQRRIAEQETRDVVGVGQVTNRLSVIASRREDSAIENDVQLDLGTDALLEKLDLQVGVKDAVVTLSGTAHSWYQQEHATDVASRQWGVKDVVNRIQVEETSSKDDAALLASIKSRLQQNATTADVYRDGDITVSVQNGVVTLVGNVKTWSQRQEAARIAILTRGVSAVDNRLTVEGYDYPWQEWYRQPDKSPRPLFNLFHPEQPFDDYFRPPGLGRQ